jgi:transposase-like protein
MGRPSKLSPEQWSEVERRLAAGEGASELSREFGVHPSQVTRRVAQKSQKVREVAQKVAEAHTALAELPMAQQYSALSLAEKLRSISTSLASAAELGAKTSHRLHSLANSEVAKVDDAEPMKQLDNLRNVGVLTKLANESAHVALNLLAANKDRVKQLDDDAAGIGGPAVPVFNITMTQG